MMGVSKLYTAALAEKLELYKEGGITADELADAIRELILMTVTERESVIFKAGK